MGKESNQYYYWKAKGGKLLYYFINGPTFKKILDKFTLITGRPSLPPLWALGYIQSRCTYWDWNQIDNVVKTMRKKDIPLDVMVIDYDWPNEYVDFVWADRWNGQSPQKISDYEKNGVRFLISNSGPTQTTRSAADSCLVSDGRNW